MASILHALLFAMSAISAPVIAVFAITLYVGIHHLITWAQVRRRRADLALGFTCLAMALFDACEVALFNLPTSEGVVTWHRLNLASIAVAGLGLLWAVGEMTGRSRRWHRLTHGALALTALLYLVDRSGFTFAQSGVNERLLTYPWLGSHVIREARPGPALYLLSLLGAVAFVEMLRMAIGHWRSTGRREGMGLLLGLSLLMATVANDVAVISGVYRAPYLIPFGYLSVVAIMSTSMTRQVASGVRAEQALYDTRHLLQALVDHSDAVIFVKDVESRYLLVNHRFEETFGVRREDLIGRSDYDVFSKEEARRFRSTDRAVLLAGNPAQIEERSGQGEQERTWLVTKFPIRDEHGEPRALGGIATDITERAAMEAALRRHHDELEERVAERTQDLQRARDDLLAANRGLEQARAAAERAAQAKSRFLATMSHEIRTPLNAVMSMVSLVLESDLQSEQRHQLETALHSANGLLRIINDILDYSKLEADHLTLELRPFRLHRLLREVGEMYTVLARAQHLAFHLNIADDLPDVVLGDEDRIRQVLSNLLSNALKFTEAGEIRLAASLDQRHSPPRVRFDVSDTGIGVPAHKQRDIFREFHQADQSVTRKYGGTGLGLAICRRIVQQFGGFISLQSTPGKGSTFTVHLPLPESHPDMLPPETHRSLPAIRGAAPRAETPDPAESATERPQPAAPAAGEQSPEDAPPAPTVASPSPAARPRLHVLVVEDNPLNQKVASALLRRLGCTVDVCDDGAQALQRLRLSEEDPPAADTPCPYDLVLMDWEMPVMDGITATKLICARMPPSWDMPVVGVTANADRSARAACLEAGMRGCLVKPITIDRLREALDSLVAYPNPAPARGGQSPARPLG